MTQQGPQCTEVSHPPVFRYAGQESLYKKILASLAKHESSGETPDAMMNLLIYGVLRSSCPTPQIMYKMDSEYRAYGAR